VCPCRSRIFSLTFIRKSKERDYAKHVERRVTYGIISQIWLNPRKGGAKARCLQVSRLEIILQAKMNLQGRTTTTLHHNSSPQLMIVWLKRMKKLKAKLASCQNAIEKLLEKMEILSIHNNELTTKLEGIGCTQEHL
jgi:hypothetical protein